MGTQSGPVRLPYALLMVAFLCTLGVGVKRLKITVSCDASSKHSASVGWPSTAFDSLRQPSTAFCGHVWNQQFAFRVKRLKQLCQCRWPHLRPSVTICSLLRPSAPIDGLGVGVKRRYGSPPSNSPQPFSYVSVGGVVRTFLTRRRGSADI